MYVHPLAVTKISTIQFYIDLINHENLSCPSVTRSPTTINYKTSNKPLFFRTSNTAFAGARHQAKQLRARHRPSNSCTPADSSRRLIRLKRLADGCTPRVTRVLSNAGMKYLGYVESQKSPQIFSIWPIPSRFRASRG